MFSQVCIHAACAWSGPPLRIFEPAPGSLALRYWEGCEALKGQLLASAIHPADFQNASRGAPVTRWTLTAEGISAKGHGGQALLWTQARNGAAEGTSHTDLRDGRILELTLTCTSGVAAGIVVGHRQGQGLTGIVCNFDRHELESGSLFPTHASSLDFEVDDTKSMPVLEYGKRLRLKLLFRKEFFELFIDDQLAQAFVQKEKLNNQCVGFYAERSDVEFREIKLWAME